MHNFLLVNADTDSITVCKPDGSDFSDQEKIDLLQSLNSLFPEKIKWADDGYFKKFVVIKAKNYIMFDGKKIKYKGSAIKDQKKEKALQEMLQEIIKCILDDNIAEIKNVYDKYIYESQNIKDINRWSKKVTVTKKLFESERKNETKIAEALKNENVSEGDKIWIYDTIDGEVQKVVKGVPQTYKDGTPKMEQNKTTKLVKYWQNDEDKDHYLKRVYSTLKILKNIINLEDFTDYSKKSNKKALEDFLESYSFNRL